MAAWAPVLLTMAQAAEPGTSLMRHCSRVGIDAQAEIYVTSHALSQLYVCVQFELDGQGVLQVNGDSAVVTVFEFKSSLAGDPPIQCNACLQSVCDCCSRAVVCLPY